MNVFRFWAVCLLFLVGCSAQAGVAETAVPPTNTRINPHRSPTPAATMAETAVHPPATTAQPQLTALPVPSPPPPIPTVPPAATNVRWSDQEAYDFRQWATFDGIPPIYEPRFSPAADAPLHDEELVMGVTLGGEAKAYPVSVLRFREMVNDELAGIPILVSW